MQRPRISLRLFLLIVALCAVCFALVRAQLDLQLAEVERQKIEIQSQIVHEEWRQRFYQDQLITVQDPRGSVVGRWIASYFLTPKAEAVIQRKLNGCDAKIQDLQTQLDSLK